MHISLPCAVTLRSLLDQSDILVQQLQKDQSKNTAINQFDLNKLSIPIMITLTQKIINSKHDLI